MDKWLKHRKMTRLWGGTTRTNLGLDMVKKDFDKRGRPGVHKIAFVLTDGNPYPEAKPWPLVQASAKALQDIADVIAVGIGGGVDQDTLKMIAGKDENVYNVADYDALIAKKDDIIKNQARQIRDLKNEIVDKDVKISEQKAQIKKLQVVISEKDDIIKNQARQIEDLKKDMIMKDDIIKKQAAQIKELQADITKKAEIIREQAVKIGFLTDQVKTYKEENDKLKENIKKLEKIIRDQKVQINQLQTRNKSLLEIIDKQVKKIHDQEATIKNQAAQILALEQSKKDLVAEITKLEKVIKEKDETISEWKENHRIIAEEISRLRVEIDQLRRDLENCRNKPNPKPAGWDSVGGKYVRLFNVYANWHEANNYCKDRGAQLISADNYETQQWVSSLYDKVWIGANDIGYEGYWVWADGSPVQNAPWDVGQPNNAWGNEDCAVANWSHDGLWHDLNCNHKLWKFACEKVNYGK